MVVCVSNLLASRAVYELGKKSKIENANLLCVFALVRVFAVSQTSSFRFLQKPGPYPVGLKVIDQYDHSRTYPASSKNLVNVLCGR